MSKQGEKYFGAKVLASFFVLAILGVSVYAFSKKDEVKNIETIVDKTETTPEEVKGDLLGRAEISFAGGTEERNKNIALGISHISGTVVRPNEEFSFTKALGPVTEEEGYSRAKVFLNGEVNTGIGGGLCQVSTTLFRTLLDAGLPITERHNHTYTVSYYDVGLDATYADPGPDLKFLNDTGHPVMIKGETKDKKAIFEIYGVNDGRIASTTEPDITQIVDIPPTLYVATTTISKNEPECVNSPQIGYTAKILYGVEYKTGKRKEQEFTSVYKPLQRVCYVALDRVGEIFKLGINPGT